MNNNDRTKHISINEGVSEDEHASDTEKNEDLTTGEGNLEEVLHRLSQFSNNINHETKSPEEETNINLSTSENLYKEPMNLHSEPHCFIPLRDSNKTDYNPQFEIGVLKFKFESFAEKVSNKLDDLAIEINSIKENKAYSIVVLESTIEELKEEKRDLCKTNAELRMENIAMKHTIADISSNKQGS